MNSGDRSELGCLQDAASRGHRAGGESPRLDRRRACSAERVQRSPETGPLGRAMTATAPMEVKKHQHKHNLKHRYEVMETLGKGTYGKVKRAVERTSLRTVSHVLLVEYDVGCYFKLRMLCVLIPSVQPTYMTS